MRTAALETGRRIAVSLEPGDDVLGSIADACSQYRIAQGVIVTLSGAFRDVELIAAQTPSAARTPERAASPDTCSQPKRTTSSRSSSTRSCTPA